MKLSKNDIEEINAACPSDQGVFSEPYGIPVDVKDPVIYMRWEAGGWTGGSYLDGERYRKTPDNKPKFRVLDMVLKRLKPDISFLEYREIEDLIHTNDEEDRDYYGNSSEYKIEYIILSELEALLEKL